MNKTVELAPDVRLSERPFTHPSYTAPERRMMLYMLQQLARLLTSQYLRQNPNATKLDVHDLIEADGRHHRIIPLRPQLLFTHSPLTVIGFFGQRNLDADGTEIAERDHMLKSEMDKHEGLLSYSSIELTNGDYGNLVLFTDETAKNQWGYSLVHAEIVQRLSPSYYSSVRLYNGCVPGTVLDTYRLQLDLVKYYDYSDPAGLWSGVRQLAVG